LKDRRAPPASASPAAEPTPVAAGEGGGERVLVVAESPDVLAVAAYHLLNAGYGVSTVRSGREGVDAIAQQRPRVVVASATLPDLSGFEIVRRLRATKALHRTGALLMMGAAHGNEATLDALAAGADDTLGHPLDPRELRLRVDALVRRLGATPPLVQESITVGPIHIDVAAHHVTVAGVAVDLTPTEYKLLLVLAEHGGRMRTRMQLLEILASANGTATTRAVDVQVYRLRRKLGAAGRLLETVSGEGYRLRRPHAPAPSA
jgi:two-component system phosphate regulon response regulator PhoB